MGTKCAWFWSMDLLAERIFSQQVLEYGEHHRFARGFIFWDNRAGD